MKNEYTKRQACFACTTPYQVIGAISIVLSEKLEADIFICDTFSGCVELSDRLDDMKIFQNVYCVSYNDIKPGLIKMPSKLASCLIPLLQIIQPERYISRILSEDVAYETFYMSSRAHIKMLLCSVLKKRNAEMKIVFFDDGLGSYQENSHALNAGRWYRWSESMLGMNKILNPKLISIQLYLYKMAQLPQYLKNCPIRQMSRLNWNNEHENKLLKTLFGLENTKEHNEKIILFDNYRDSKSRIEMFKKIDVCFQKVFDLAGADNILFKGHPRSLVTPRIPFTNIAKQGLPMEVIYSDMDDLESRILIAYNSTAVYTPKMLFGKEPWVICLHRIVGTAPQENPEGIYQMFLSEYKTPQKLLAPNSIEELQNILFGILNQK